MIITVSKRFVSHLKSFVRLDIHEYDAERFIIHCVLLFIIIVYCVQSSFVRERSSDMTAITIFSESYFQYLLKIIYCLKHESTLSPLLLQLLNARAITKIVENTYPGCLCNHRM